MSVKATDAIVLQNLSLFYQTANELNFMTLLSVLMSTASRTSEIPGGGGYMTWVWMGRLQVGLPSGFQKGILFYENHPFLTIFRQFLVNPPMKENLPKRNPCLENFGPETHPYGRHIPVPSTCYVTPPPHLSLKMMVSRIRKNVANEYLLQIILFGHNSSPFDSSSKVITATLGYRFVQGVTELAIYLLDLEK